MLNSMDLLMDALIAIEEKFIMTCQQDYINAEDIIPLITISDSVEKFMITSLGENVTILQKTYIQYNKILILI